ncbi:MAG: hypothetical protein H0X24_12280 [Ktedonobacterales bacterium]|nr:hypothetical protein [Ktedonobacterales bacterium]
MAFSKRLLAVFFALGGLLALGNGSPVFAAGGTTCSPYAVQLGDTAASVAAHFGTSVARLAQDNQIIAFSGSRMLPTTATVQVCKTANAAYPRTSIATALRGQPCQSGNYWPSGTLNTDATPPGCYSGDYRIASAHYPRVPTTFGGCDWWPRALHPTWDIWSLPKHTTPKVGAVIWFAPGEQGAASEGHWGVVVAISADGRYILSSEMNTTYYNRYGHGGAQGGYGHVIYRYIRNDAPRTLYVYP